MAVERYVTNKTGAQWDALPKVSKATVTFVGSTEKTISGETDFIPALTYIPTHVEVWNDGADLNPDFTTAVNGDYIDVVITTTGSYADTKVRAIE